MNRDSSLALFFSLTAVALLVFKLTVSEPSHVDEIFFKAPGLSWVKGDGWRSPEEPGYGGWQPPLERVFASYPPLYPFFFGCGVKVFGFGWRVCAVYDAGIHVLLASTFVLFLRSAVPSRPSIAWITGLLFLLVSYPPRPDRLAMVFGYGALTLLLKTDIIWNRRIFIIAGLLFGFCMGTSVPCAVALAPMLLALISFGAGNVQRAVSRLLMVGSVALITFLMIVAPIFLYNPGALQQNLEATRGVTSFGLLPSLAHLVRHHYPTLFALGFVALPGVWTLSVLHLSPGKVKLTSWIVWYGTTVLPLVLFTAKSTFQGNYHWFFIPWFTAALFQTCIHGPQLLKLAPALLSAAFLLLAAFNIRIMASAWLTPVNRRIMAFREHVESLVPAGATVLSTGEYWWLLAGRNPIVDLLDNGALGKAQVEYIIVTGLGAGASGRHKPLPPFADQGDYFIISNQLDSDKPLLLGFPLSRSTFSPAPVIFRRQ